MPVKQKSFRVSITLQGDMARAFIKEWTSRIEVDPNTSKSDVARDIMVDGLKARGHDVENAVQWGGSRQRQDDEEGQRVAVAVA